MQIGDIGERIKDLRIKKGMSLQDVADRLEVNRSSVMRWEKGEISKIKLPVLETLAFLFGTTANYLLCGDEKEEWVNENSIKNDGFCHLPLIGKVCAGNGILAEENILRYEVADKKYETGEYFYLQV